MEFPGMRVIHLPGVENVLPDHLSRLFTGVTWTSRGGHESEGSCNQSLRVEQEPGQIDLSPLSKAKKPSSKLQRAPEHIMLKRTSPKTRNGLPLHWGKKNFIQPSPLDIDKAIRRAERHGVEQQATTVLCLPEWKNAK